MEVAMVLPVFIKICSYAAKLTDIRVQQDLDRADIWSEKKRKKLETKKLHVCCVWALTS